MYVAYVREVFVGKRGADPELSVYWCVPARLRRPPLGLSGGCARACAHARARQDVPAARNRAQARLHRDVGQRRDAGGAQPRARTTRHTLEYRRALPPRRARFAALTPRPPQLFISSHADNIPAESLVHCAVVRFLLSPPAEAAPKGAGYFAARVYEPSTGAVHTLESGNFAEPFAAEVRFIFEGPGRQRSASAGALLPSDQALPLKPAKTPAASKAAPGSKTPASPPAATASPSPAAPPAVLQQPRGAPPPPVATVASTLREALRREETQAGRVRLLTQVASASDELRAALDVKEAAANIASWVNLALRRGPPAGTEAANALLSAAIKALAALQLTRPALVGPKGKPVVDAVRLAGRSATVAPRVRGEAAALAARWHALISEGGAAAEGEDFFASPRSTEAAATLAAVARRNGSGSAKTPLAASNGGGAAVLPQPTKPTPAGKRAAPPAAAADDDDDDAPPPAKRVKGASPLAAAAAATRAEAAATRAVAHSTGALARVPLTESKKQGITEAVTNTLTAVNLALQLSRTARAAIVEAAAGDTDDADALIQARSRWTVRRVMSEHATDVRRCIASPPLSFCVA